MAKPKLMTLGSLKQGTEFWFGAIRFRYLGISDVYPELIYCSMERNEHFVYISPSALVSLEL